MSHALSLLIYICVHCCRLAVSSEYEKYQFAREVVERRKVRGPLPTLPFHSTPPTDDMMKQQSQQQNSTNNRNKSKKNISNSNTNSFYTEPQSITSNTVPSPVPAPRSQESVVMRFDKDGGGGRVCLVEHVPRKPYLKHHPASPSNSITTTTPPAAAAAVAAVSVSGKSLGQAAPSVLSSKRSVNGGSNRPLSMTIGSRP